MPKLEVPLNMIIIADPDFAYGRKANDNGLWCMTRWECRQCRKHGRALWLEETLRDGQIHEQKTGHKRIFVRHGAFLKEDYGMEEPRSGINV